MVALTLRRPLASLAAPQSAQQRGLHNAAGRPLRRPPPPQARKGGEQDRRSFGAGYRIARSTERASPASERYTDR